MNTFSTIITFIHFANSYSICLLALITVRHKIYSNLCLHHEFDLIITDNQQGFQLRVHWWEHFDQHHQKLHENGKNIAFWAKQWKMPICVRDQPHFLVLVGRKIPLPHQQEPCPNPVKTTYITQKPQNINKLNVFKVNNKYIRMNSIYTVLVYLLLNLNTFSA